MRTLLVVAVLTLSGGLLLGWVFFSGNGEEEHSHTEMIDGETVWTCSMHPQIRQNEPGDCPICGMDLIALEADNDDGIDPDAVTMSATAMQLANVSTIVVGKSQANASIRLNGKVVENEEQVYTQASHIPGRVESLRVNFTGEFVQKGQPIATIYSPELVNAQQELFEAMKIKDTQPALFKAARKKLSNWKLTQEQIDKIIANGQPIETLPIYAERSGYVQEKLVMLGDYIKQGAPIYMISDLSSVWVVFDVYERDLSVIRKGDVLTFTISSLPGQTFEGSIAYIDPVIDPKTRVAKARVVAKNPNYQLKPEMFASAELKSKVGESESLTVPKSAVMWTGKRSVVYVKLATDQGLHFKMREVTLGPALGEAYVIEEGLEPGEEIAVNGTFSIDAAAQLAGKPSMMSPEGGDAMTGHDHRGMSQGTSQSNNQMDMLQVNESEVTYDSDPEFKEQLQVVFSAYLPVKDALIESDVKTASKEAGNLKKAIDEVDMKLVKDEAHMEWMEDLKVLQKSAERIQIETDLEKARMMLSPLSDQLFHTLKKYQVQVEGYRQYCPMAFDNTGAFWLSDSDKILNPYFGDVMLTCGNVEEHLNKSMN